MEWKTIDGFPSYEVSSNGDVRFAGGMRRNIHGEYMAKPRLLTKHQYDGYSKVSIYSYEGKKHTRRVCRLVLEAFVPRPSDQYECNHKNANRSDDRIENLEWTTKSENCLHRCRVTKNIPTKGERHPRARWTDSDILEMRRLWPALSQRAIAKRFNTTQPSVQRIVKRKGWKHI